MNDAIGAFSSAAISALSPILMALGTAALAQAFAWLRAHSHSAAATTALGVLDDITTAVVTELEQTVVAALKATHPDGKLTGADGERLKQAALTKIQGLYGPRGLTIVAHALKVSDDQVLQLVGAKVEAAVYQVGMDQQMPSGEAGPVIKVVTAPMPVSLTQPSAPPPGPQPATDPGSIPAMSTPASVAADIAAQNPRPSAPAAAPAGQGDTPPK